MGVPGFFLWLMKSYKKEGFVFSKERLSMVDIKKLNNQEQIDKALKTNLYVEPLLNDVNSIDWFLIDANCLIHPVCFKVVAENPDLKDNSKLEAKMMIAVLNYLDKIIQYVNPKKGVYLAIDGVAPVAKIKQQRSRRFKSIADKSLWDNIKKKHSQPTGNYWNNNAVTPGTTFMVNLHNRIIEWCKNKTIEIIYSSCFTPAEGEHKLLQFIRSNQKSNINYSYVIYGLDADLIFLALSTESNSIYLLREANEINKNESKEVLNYVSIKIMRESIVNTMTKYVLESTEEKLYGFDKMDPTRLVNDFIFMCYFLGNDFLPHIPSLDIHRDGIESLIIAWSETLIESVIDNNKLVYLLNEKKDLQSKTLKKVNTDFINKFITKLASTEEGILRDNFAKGRKRMKCDGGTPYEQEVFRIENLQFKIDDPINLGSDEPEKWRARYYNHYWDVKQEEIEEFSEKLVSHYLIGVKWVTQYYFDKCPSWDWYYPYEHPPFISDIAKYLNKIDINKMKFTIGKPLKPFMQLLAVLPPQSNYLLPINLRKLVLNQNSSIAFMYPMEFEQDFINKKKYWMAIPNLPPLDFDMLKHSYYKYENEIKKEDLIRNDLKEPYEFNIKM
jgi:5'-3' exoribonuclease 2